MLHCGSSEHPTSSKKKGHALTRNVVEFNRCATYGTISSQSQNLIGFIVIFSALYYFQCAIQSSNHHSFPWRVRRD